MREQIIEQISTVFDPEIPVNVWELGLIYDIQIQPNHDVDIRMTLQPLTVLKQSRFPLKLNKQ